MNNKSTSNTSAQNEKNTEKKPSKVLKFSPVKSLVIESRSEYYRTIVCAIGVGISHVFIGATLMVTFMYTLSSRDLHVVLCTLGYQFFCIEGILSFSFVNGWSGHFRLKHRKCAHILMQMCGMGCTILGVATVMVRKGITVGAHTGTGFFTAALTLLSVLTSPLAIYDLHNIKLLHMGCGLPTLLMSSICLCLGFYTREFKSWAGGLVVYILISIVIFNTLCICAVTLVKYILKLRH